MKLLSFTVANLDLAASLCTSLRPNDAEECFAQPVISLEEIEAIEALGGTQVLILMCETPAPKEGERPGIACHTFPSAIGFPTGNLASMIGLEIDVAEPDDDCVLVSCENGKTWMIVQASGGSDDS